MRLNLAAHSPFNRETLPLWKFDLPYSSEDANVSSFDDYELTNLARADTLAMLHLRLLSGSKRKVHPDVVWSDLDHSSYEPVRFE